MHTRRLKRTSLHQQRWPLYTMLMAFFFFFMSGIIGITPAAYASGMPGGNVADPLVRAVDIAKPAVVRIYTTIRSQLIVHFSPTKSVTFPQGGSYVVTLSGTGTFITTHGDILTADHVINPPHDQQLSKPLDMQAASDIAAYINQNQKPHPPVTQDQISQELISGQLPSDINYGTPTSQVFLSTDYTGPLTAPDISSVPAQFQAPVDRIEQESALSNKDIAIVHVSMDDTASIQLGDSSNVEPQDTLTIIGFPGNGDVSQQPTNLLTSSVNQVIVSSIKTNDQGAQLIQVGGNVEHGDSGGPALDSNGNVVGIVSFALSEQGNTNFLQASNSARALVQNLHLDTTPGPFERAWSQAFSDYAATTPGHWHKAAQEFGTIHSQYPLFQAIMPDLQYAQTEGTTQSQPQRTGISPYVWTILAIVIVIVLAVVLFALAARRRGNKGPMFAATLRPAQLPLPTTIAQQRQNFPVPPQQTIPDALAAFGAPSRTLPGIPAATAGTSGGLRPWPCGHMNRPNARYCSICGEPDPPPPTIRRVEQ